MRVRLNNKPRPQAVVKRAMDLLIATATLVATGPIIIGLGIVIRCTSPGPALFRQVRIGLGERPFQLLKLRSMTTDNDDSAHRAMVEAELADPLAAPETSDGVFKLEEDPRVTSIGHFIRRSSLDEFPQFLNVLRGEMSIVGPRPLTDWEHELIPKHLAVARTSVKPGLTGLWQVSGRNHLSTLQMLELDRCYVESLRHNGLWTDFKILAATPKALIHGGGAR